jgi:hypothetical protein
MSIEKKIRIQNLYDTQANWEAVESTAVPRKGEIVIYEDNGIQKIKIGDGNTPLKDLRYAADMYEVLYGYSTNEVFRYNSKTTTSIDQPNKYKCLLIEKDVISIDTSITENFKHVESVQFEKGIKLTEILSSAFEGYSKITDMNIPQGVGTIHFSAFKNCSNLKRISIPTTVNSIQIAIDEQDNPHGILEGCNSLEYIEVPFTGIENFENFKDTDKNEDGTPIDTNQGIFGHLFGCSKSDQQDKFVPGSLKTIKITNANHIHARTFEKCRHVETIEITLSGDTATIEPGLFRDCNSLTHIHVDGSTVYEVKNNCIMKGTELVAGCNSSRIPEGTTKICYEAFRGAIHLLRADLPATVTTLESAVFKNCHSLNAVTQGDGPLTVSPSSECFLECRSLYSIKLDCARIGHGAFGYCSTLISISISDTCIQVDPYAFMYCTSLTQLTIPDSVRRHLTEQDLSTGQHPGDYTCIGEYAFVGCDALTNLTIPEIAKFGLDTAGKIYPKTPCVLGQMFGGSYDTANGIHPNDKVPASLKTVTLTKQKSLPADCFKNCYYIETVETSNNITSVGTYTFKDCRNLVNIPNINSLTTIPEGMFYGCEQIKSVTIGNKVTSIGDDAFRSCYSLTSVTIPDDVEIIGSYAFYGCNSLESITLPFVGASRTPTENEAHFGYIFGASLYSDNSSYIPKSLKTVVITGGTSIGRHAFENCSSLTTVDIRYGVTSISSFAFYYCTGLMSITIPPSVTSIYWDAFYGCDSLTSVHITDLAAWCNIDFENVHSNPLSSGNGYLYGQGGNIVTELVIPDMSSGKECYIKKYSFFNCQTLQLVRMYDNRKNSKKTLVSVGQHAFERCNNLLSVSLIGHVTRGVEFADSCFAYSGIRSFSVTNPANLGSKTFKDCLSLKYVYIDTGYAEGYALSNTLYLTANTFSNCINLSEIEIINTEAESTRTDNNDNYIRNVTMMTDSGLRSSKSEKFFLNLSGIQNSKQLRAISEGGSGAGLPDNTVIKVPSVGQYYDIWSEDPLIGYKMNYNHLFGLQSEYKKTSSSEILEELGTTIESILFYHYPVITDSGSFMEVCSIRQIYPHNDNPSGYSVFIYPKNASVNLVRYVDSENYMFLTIEENTTYQGNIRVKTYTTSEGFTIPNTYTLSTSNISVRPLV